MPSSRTDHFPNPVSILGAGWLGLPLGEALLARGCVVRGSSTRAERLPLIEEAGLLAHQLKAEETVTGDKLDEFFSSEVLILNIPPGRRRPDVETRYSTQVAAILDRARTGGVRNILFVSSTGVYGEAAGVVDEGTMPDPNRPSGRALWQAENLVRQGWPQEATILRLAGLVGGSRQPANWLAGKKNLPNGAAPVNLVHRDDCIGLILAVLQQAAWGELFNACADEHPPRQVFYPAQAKKAGLPPPTFAPESEGRYKVVSNQKIKDRLGYRLKHPDPMAF